MKHFINSSNPMRGQFEPKGRYAARHFSWDFDAASGVGTLTLNRPER